MDFWAALHDLHEERKRVETLIRALEALSNGGQPGRNKGRGRRNMPPDERKIVSERMKNYWASRRKVLGGERESTS
jgi:hypothetical protein